MKKIIFPTDFSTAAQHAYSYATALADSFQSKLKLVHICHPSVDSTYGLKLDDTNALIEMKKAQLDRFAHQDDKQNLTAIVATSMHDQEVRLGYAANEIVNISKEENTDFILMSTTGEAKFMEKIFGSVSTHVAKHAHCPVWFVPPNAKFQGIKNILYASDYESANKKSIDNITELANRFEADVHLVHVNESNKKADYQFEELILQELFRKKGPSLSFQLSTVHSDQVWEGIDQYAQKQDIDLVVMLTHHRSFWEDIWHKSKTRSMILHSKTPLLIMHLED